MVFSLLDSHHKLPRTLSDARDVSCWIRGSPRYTHYSQALDQGNKEYLHLSLGQGLSHADPLAVAKRYKIVWFAEAA